MQGGAAACYLLFLLLAAAVPAGTAAPAQPTFQPKLLTHAAGDRVIVKFKAASGKVGAAAATRLEVKHLTGDETVDAALKRLSSRPDVAYAVPDYYLQLTVSPNDPDYSQQWGLPRIGAPPAWGTSTGSSAAGRAAAAAVTVCVVDSGIDPTHPDLKVNLHPLIGLNAVNTSAPMMDSNGHGTHVSGIIAAVGNNALGVSGVVWGGAVQVLSCRFIGTDGYGLTSTAITCIEYCTGNGAQIISASWTGGTTVNPPLQDAISAATAAGALFVTAAGNQGYNMDTTPTYPAAYSTSNAAIISVSAIDQNDALPSFSNYGSTTVQLAAPGVSILSTTPGATYQSWSGTSMATPFVSGAAALVLAACGRSNGLTSAQLRQIFVSTAEAVPAFAGKCTSGGVLRVDLALAAALGPSAKPSPSPSISSSAIYRTVTTTNWVPCYQGSSKACRKRCTTKRTKVKGKVKLTTSCLTLKPRSAYVRAVVTTKRVPVRATAMAPAAATAVAASTTQQTTNRRLLRDLP